MSHVFIPLNTIMDGKVVPVLINLAQLIAVQPDKGTTQGPAKIFMVGLDKPFVAQQTYDQVMRMITDALKS
jgi:hypothetical protein